MNMVVETLKRDAHYSHNVGQPARTYEDGSREPSRNFTRGLIGTLPLLEDDVLGV